ncbi:hypothetical protein BMW26_11245 [Microbacterium sp. 1.5R]|uniref:GNAT family N-acetyltransferase n=1 Tax=Microbacterium sp. 1.5R TaxID=1916917 RepID=UPI00090C475E|nr:GNAT family N-acetyltransferase [Microbacterium sp. 1.5R]APH45462.1 hypothetical protein BMW26_11245 [Microbacterium sp. 1.5R]
MADVEIYRWSPGGPRAAVEYERVLDLHRDNRATLGHLPFAAFQEAGTHGRLILGAIEGTVQGYVLYSTPRQQTVKLVHVCVALAARGSGLAKAMVDAAIDAHPQRSIVTAHCRTDYDMDGFWRSLDMSPTGERPGRAAKGSTLTIWTRRIGQFDLMENALYESSRPIAVLDSNVVIDLFASTHMNRPDREESKGLTADWLVDVVELAVSPEVSIEINHLPASERQRVQHSLGALVALRRHADMRTLAEAIIARMPPSATSRDRSLVNDAKHLADAILAGADYFVTRDESFLAATAEWSQDAYAVTVLRPVDLLRTFIPPSAPTEFRSGQLESVGLRWTQVTTASPDLEDAFTDVPNGEKGRNFRKLLHAALAHPATVRLELLTDEQGRRWALLATELRGDTMQICVGRVARGSLGGTIAFQLTRYIRSLALERGASEVQVADDALDPVLRAALGADGFEGAPLTVRLAHHPDPAETSSILLSNDVADYERKNWPQVLLDKNVPVRIVPIQPRYARDLLGFNDTLIQTRDQPALGFAREFVYFAKPKMKHWEIPTRVLWYVTKDPKARESSAVRAVVAHSRVIDAQVIDAQEAVEQYRTLGVLRGGDIEGHADDGKVLVLRFEDTHMLDMPLGKRAFHALLREHGITTSLMTTRAGSPSLFDDVLRTQPGWENR